MHIFFSGIGGTGIGPLALIAKAAGYEVSGSDKQDSQYVRYLREHGISDIHIGQTTEAIQQVHANRPIDWYVYSSSLPLENPDHPELTFVEAAGITHSKRDKFLRHLLDERRLKMIAIAGTHGKTTTTAMAIWVFKQLGLPMSYSVGAKIGFGEMAEFNPDSEYFIYECDEFDRNFLSFDPHLSLITGLAWDHHDIYPTMDAYREAFNTFIRQSQRTVLWHQDAEFMKYATDTVPATCTVLPDDSQILADCTLPGYVNRRDALLVASGLYEITNTSLEHLVQILNTFPGVSRRMEKITDGLYSDYAHTPEKLAGGTQVALEIAHEQNKQLIVVYEPLTNRRMHYTKAAHETVFNGVSHIYWVPSYLAREDPSLEILAPETLITYLSPQLQSVATPSQLDENLEKALRAHLANGDIVVCFSGGGGGSLDEWVRTHF